MSSFPPEATQLADDVDVLIVKHGVAPFLEKVRQWVEHHCEALKRLDAWESRRRRYFENMDSAHQDKAKPPNDDCLWDDMVVADDEGELNRLAARAEGARKDGVTSMWSNAPARSRICGYVPPNLHSIQRPNADLPLPLLEKPTSILEKYAALCAVRDQVLVKDIGVESPHFEILKAMVKNVVGEDRWRILGGYLRDAEADVAALPDEGERPTGKKRPPKATVNMRMLDELQKNPDVRGWGCKEWAQLLKCGKSTVCETKVWKELDVARAVLRAKRTKDRRRKPKASDQRRD